MSRFVCKQFCILVAFALAFINFANALAMGQAELDAAIADAAEYIYKTVKTPRIGVVGGEWAVLGLARSGYDIPEEYYQNYYSAVESHIKAQKGELHPSKYTEYSRLAVALTAIGKDPTDVAGYNLLEPLGDYDKTIWQGLNGPVWALIALDCANYEMPQNTGAKTRATRDMYVNYILENQLLDGGFSLLGKAKAEDLGGAVSDPDITGMALAALARYQDREDVKKAIQKALDCMSKMQQQGGGYASGDTENAESCAQMIIALSELGISIQDPRFVKGGNTLLDSLMSYYKKGEGFSHTKGEGNSSQMAAEQGLCAMVAAKRLIDGKSSLYNMSDRLEITDADLSNEKAGLPGKHQDIKPMPAHYAEITFSDILDHKNKTAIEQLAARGIISGKSETHFDPDSTMTRAEFATIIVRGLGLEVKGGNVFSDVSQDDWFFEYVNTAFEYKIVNGTGDGIFSPNGTITREEAGAMIARASGLCGISTDMDETEARDVLAGFIDYISLSDWSRKPLAFCYKNNILPSEDIKINPKANVTRAEIAKMLFTMLDLAKLL